MELVIPSTMTMTMGGIAAFLGIFATILGVYYRLANSLTDLRGKFEKMEQRNSKADEETEAVKIEQARQKTTVSVMAERLENQSKTIDRIDRNIEELIKRTSIVRND